MTNDPDLPSRVQAAQEDERALIGEMLRNPSEIAQVASAITPDDFLDYGHRAAYAAILSLWTASVPVTLDSVYLQLVRDGRVKDFTKDDLTDCWAVWGGVGMWIPRLVRLLRCRTALRSLEHTASVVLDRSRRVEVVQGDEAESVLAEAYGMLNRCMDHTRGAGPKLLGQAVHECFDRIDRRSRGEDQGHPSGFTDLDELFVGFRPGELVTVGARPSVGKAQPLTCRVLTPNGFRLMGDIRVGDLVTGSDGRPCRVTGVFPQGEIDAYRVTFSDGTSTECCADHLWFTQTRKERRLGSHGSVKSLREIVKTLARDSGSRLNHAIPLVKPVEYAGAESRELKLHPYVMGLLLGDGGLTTGSAKFSNPEPDIQARLKQLLPPGDALTIGPDCKDCYIKRKRRNNDRSETCKAIESYGLLGLDSRRKFVPHDYAHASPSDRLELLRGLLDTDGSVNQPSGLSVEYGTSSPTLARDVADLVRSLGGVVSVNSRIPHYTYKGERLAGARSYRLVIYFPDGTVPVSSAKHLAKWGQRTRTRRRSIASVEPVGRVPCQCIKVDAPDSLYVTDDFIVTHNTALALALSLGLTRAGAVVAFASLEQPAVDLAERSLAMDGRVYSDVLRRGDLTPVQISQASSSGERLAKLRLWIDDGPKQDLARLAATGERIRSTEGRLDVYVVDYLQLLSSPPGGDRKPSRQEQVAEISTGLKRLARTLNCCVLALAQLNREVESRSGTPRLSDLRDSGQIEQDSDVVMLLHRGERPPPGRPHRLEVILAKQRNGPVGSCVLEMDPDTYTFGDSQPPGF